MKTLNLFSLGLSILLLSSCTEENNTGNNSNENTNTSTTLKSETAPTLAELKNDNNIIWMGEIMVDYAPNYYKWTAQAREKAIMDSAGFVTRNEFKILKQQVTDLNESSNDDHNLVYKFIKNIESLKCYQDAQLSQPYSVEDAKKQINSIDTVITFDPKTQEELLQVVVNELDPFDVKFFRVKELIYYNKKAMTFKTIPMALAPMVCQFDNKGHYINSKALFWIKPNFMTTTPSLNAENITWAKRLHRRCSLGEAKITKSDKTLAETMNIMMEDLRKNADKVHVAHVFDQDGNEKMTAEEITNLGASVDTIITFDPKTFEQIIQVVHNKFAGKDIQNLRLMQDWIWDDATKQLNICYVGFKPIINRYDDNGNFLNSGPMFTRRANADKK